jgi:Cu+-exporting ATPase
MKFETITIAGMACPACAKGIEKTVAALRGVSKASVSFDESELALEYDERLLPEGSIREIAAGIVHDVVDEMARASYSAQTPGLKCPECAAGAEEILKSSDGVFDASVNFRSKRARVTYDPRALGIERLRGMVGEASCGAGKYTRAKDACECRE